MNIESLAPPQGSRKKRKRVGRGPGSGHGKTSCKGHKGQKARSGGGKGPGFEGGQMPLQRRIPKRGFTNIFRKEYTTVNLKDLKSIKADVITPESLLEEGIIRGYKDGVKILGDGEVERPFVLRAHKFSKGAREKILSAGGKVEVI
ncbi:MAG: 50S ribosomal protein L15 [Nitrospirae bacterium]|nr:50S ribosomal protein L15 [Nitrospirota bacterium]